MGLSNYKSLHVYQTITEINTEILQLQKTLFDLKMSKFSAKNIKPHMLVHLRRKIAQLKFKSTILKKT